MNRADLIPFNTINTVYNDDCYVMAGGCNYIEFINNGDANVTVDNVIILPFGSWSPTPPIHGEVNNTQYTAIFATSNNKNLVVVRKFYNI